MMAEAGVLCVVCKGICVCGHYVCATYSCKTDGLDTSYPGCEGFEIKDQPDDAEHLPQLLRNEHTAMSVDDTIGGYEEQVETDDDEQLIDEGDQNDCRSPEEHIFDMINEGLVTARKTFEYLDDSIQSLECLNTRSKNIEESLSALIQQEFQQIHFAVDRRKSVLLSELKSVFNVYSSDIKFAANEINKQKECLQTRIDFAETLKQSPSTAEYCNLNRLVADLKEDFKNQTLIDSLKASPNISFDKEWLLEEIEKLECIFNVSAPGSAMVQATEFEAKDMEEDCPRNIGCIINDKNNNRSRGQLRIGHTHSVREKSSLPSKEEASLLHSSIDPDVVVEEIIEWQSDAESICRKTKKFKKNLNRVMPAVQMKTTHELVYLCYVIDPCNLYVHRMSEKKPLIMLEQKLHTLSRTTCQCSPTDILELGEIISVYSKLLNVWCRGCIREMIPQESECTSQPCCPGSYRIEQILFVTFFLLDYGSSEIFVVTRFAAHYPKSVHTFISQTKVDDLCPMMRKLSPEDKELMQIPPFAIHCSLDVIPPTPDGLWPIEVRNYILRVVNNKCVVMKVLREEDKRLIVDLKKPPPNKISSDMPVSLRESLVFLDLAKFPSNVPIAPISKYGNPILPMVKTETIVLICHANDPSDFYIHMVGDQEYKKLVNRLEEVYNSKESEDLKLTCPVVGQVCVAKFTSDQQWYRAEIIEFTSSEDALVKYVDFGNVAKVNVGDLRQIKDEFMTFPPKAICCKLAYIQPIFSEVLWSTEAVAIFNHLTSYKRLRCITVEILNDNKVSVELFASHEQVISINALMVRERVACFEPLSQVVVKNHDLPLEEVWDPLPDTVEKCTDAASMFEHKELDVLISHVVSPSKIYVQWLSTKSILMSLQSRMSDNYEKSKPEDVEWQVEMHVAVHLESDKRWLRGQIKSVISKDKVEVFCYDYGTEEVTDVIHLRTLDDNLKIYGAMCLECSLKDIQPAGGSPNWTATACDYLCYYLNGAIGTLKIDDNASQWPLPVTIQIRNEADQLVDVSDQLVKRGLALRDRRLKKHDSLMDVKETTKLANDTEVSVEEITTQPELEDVKAMTVEENNTASSEEPIIKDFIDNPYLPPHLPKEKTFRAKVSCIAEDGTIYVIQESLEPELSILMLDIQNSFKCLGLMVPYSWKKGEGCLIKGSDTMSYRGTVLEILGGGLMKVQYEDFGYTEKIPKCHLYPSVFNPNIARFCIPCHLHDVIPVGNSWQPDAIQFLKELLLDRVVCVHIVNLPQGHCGIASVNLFCGSALVSAILEIYSHCHPRNCEEKLKLDTELLNIDVDSCTERHFVTEVSNLEIFENDFKALLLPEPPILPNYTVQSLPHPGEVFTVQVTHLQTPNLVFITLKNEGSEAALGDSGECDNDNSVESVLKRINRNAEACSLLADFRTAMPCLAYYNDGLLHRAQLQSIKSYDPITLVVEFVDYGSTAVLETSSIFELPEYLIKYPAKAINVKLAGFKPPKEDSEIQRIPYCQEWSLKALYDMIDLVQGKQLTATCVSGFPENIVYLYDENQQLVHKPLITSGLAELE